MKLNITLREFASGAAEIELSIVQAIAIGTAAGRRYVIAAADRAFTATAVDATTLRVDDPGAAGWLGDGGASAVTMQLVEGEV